MTGYVAGSGEAISVWSRRVTLTNALTSRGLSVTVHRSLSSSFASATANSSAIHAPYSCRSARLDREALHHESRRAPGRTGSTIAGCTARSPPTTPTSPRPSSRRRTTVRPRPPSRPFPSSPGSHGTRGGPHVGSSAGAVAGDRGGWAPTRPSRWRFSAHRPGTRKAVPTCPVSSARPSNRACGFPAHGSPTFIRTAPVGPAPSAPSVGVGAELEKLAELRAAGALSEEEFATMKAVTMRQLGANLRVMSPIPAVQCNRSDPSSSVPIPTDLGLCETHAFHLRCRRDTQMPSCREIVGAVSIFGFTCGSLPRSPLSFAPVDC